MKLIAGFLLLLATTAASAECDHTQVAAIRSALQKGRGVLLIAWANSAKCGDDDEACGDWADALNTQAHEFAIFKIASGAWPRAIAMKSSKIAAQSSLFMKTGQKTYFHDGPIHDPQVYPAVREAWAGDKDSVNRQFLPPAIEANLCEPSLKIRKPPTESKAR